MDLTFSLTRTNYLSVLASLGAAAVAQTDGGSSAALRALAVARRDALPLTSTRYTLPTESGRLNPMTYDEALKDQQRRREEQARRERQARDQEVVFIVARMRARKADVFDFNRPRSREPGELD